MSTVIAIIMLDMMLFGSGVQGAVIDQTQMDATKKLKGKIIFAFERLHPAIRGLFQVLKSNDHTLSVKVKEMAGDTASEIQAGMNARGDTFQILHISEWGPIAFNDPKRSDEIFTGAMPAAKSGLVVVETTWKGGKVGHLWDLTKNAMELVKEPGKRTTEDFTLFFFPWWGDPVYTLEGDVSQISPECVRYLDEAQAEINAERAAEGRNRWHSRRRNGFGITSGRGRWGCFAFRNIPRC
jgi:hypothetical protein